MTPDANAMIAEPDGAERIAAERQRQVDAEGWTAMHDDDHEDESLLLAAFCYLHDLVAYSSENVRPAHSQWPWEAKAWKPTPENPVRQLEKAGALIAAEIDRRLRDAPAQQEER